MRLRCLLACLHIFVQEHVFFGTSPMGRKSNIHFSNDCSLVCIPFLYSLRRGLKGSLACFLARLSVCLLVCQLAHVTSLAHSFQCNSAWSNASSSALCINPSDRFLRNSPTSAQADSSARLLCFRFGLALSLWLTWNPHSAQQICDFIFILVIDFALCS